jgi:hypothetical protein
LRRQFQRELGAQYAFVLVKILTAEAPSYGRVALHLDGDLHRAFDVLQLERGRSFRTL